MATQCIRFVPSDDRRVPDPYRYFRRPGEATGDILARMAKEGWISYPEDDWLMCLVMPFPGDVYIAQRRNTDAIYWFVPYWFPTVYPDHVFCKQIEEHFCDAF